MATTRPAPKFTAGQRVEVLRPDFTQPGFPETWQTGTVDSVLWLDSCRLWDVSIVMDSNRWLTQRVGPRGGNRHLRAA